MYNTKLTLDLSGRHTITGIDAKSGDKDSRTVEIQLTDKGQIYTIPSGSTAELRCTKPSGSIARTSASISGNKITAKLSDQALAESGQVLADVILYGSNGTRLSSASFYIRVNQSAGEGREASADELNIFENIVSDVLADTKQKMETEAQRVSKTLPKDYTEMIMPKAKATEHTRLSYEISDKEYTIPTIEELASTAQGIRDELSGNVYSVLISQLPIVGKGYYYRTNGQKMTAAWSSIRKVPMNDAVYVHADAHAKMELATLMIFAGGKFKEGYLGTQERTITKEDLAKFGSDAEVYVCSVDDLDGYLTTLTIYTQTAVDIHAARVNTQKREYPLAGKKIYCLGDSITYGYGLTDRTTEAYPALLANMLKADVVNGGVSATTVSEVGTDDEKKLAFTRRIGNVPKDTDYLIIFGGTNDYWKKQTELSVIENYNNWTFYGAMNNLFSYLQKFSGINQGGRVLFVFPYNQYFNNVDSFTDFGKGTLKDFRDAAKKVCDKYCVPMLDLSSESNMNLAFEKVRAYYGPDGVHPNAAGHQRIAELIAAKLLTI